MKKPSVLFGVLAGLLGWLTVGLFLVWKWAQIPPQVPLFYSLPWGESWLILKSQLWLVTAAFGASWAINNLLAFLSREEPLLSSFLIWGGALVQILFAVTALRTLFIIL